MLMKKIIDIILIIGFLFVDFILFHDIFKPGEQHSVVEYLTGALSIIVIIKSAQSILKKN
jgi:hypothetical protein